MKNPWFELSKLMAGSLGPYIDIRRQRQLLDLFLEMKEAEESFGSGEMIFPGYYNDYPTEKIGGNNPYSQCRFCGRSTPEINGDLDGHSECCEYRLRKEEELKDKFLFEILNQE
jgi:hypothetical protein